MPFRERPDIRWSRKRRVHPQGIDSDQNLEGRRGLEGQDQNPVYEDLAKPRTRETPDPFKQVDQLFVNLAGVIGKADQLLTLAESMPRALYIPVDELSRPVRQAVARRDREVPDGSKISFSLFKKAIQKSIDQYKFIDLEYLDNMRNEPWADSALFQANWTAGQMEQTLRQLDGEVGDPGFNEEFRNRLGGETAGDRQWLAKLLIASAPLIFLYLDNKLQGPFSSLDRAATTSTKLVPGTEVPIVLIQILVGLALYILIHNLSGPELEEQLNNAGYGKALQSAGLNVSVAELVDKAIRLANGEEVDGQTLEDLPINVGGEFLRLAHAFMGQGDWEIIREYSIGWLMDHASDGRYQPWHAWMDGRLLKHDLDQAMQLGPEYSPLMRRHAADNGITRTRQGASYSPKPDGRPTVNFDVSYENPDDAKISVGFPQNPPQDQNDQYNLYRNGTLEELTNDALGAVSLRDSQPDTGFEFWRKTKDAADDPSSLIGLGKAFDFANMTDSERETEEAGMREEYRQTVGNRPFFETGFVGEVSRLDNKFSKMFDDLGQSLQMDEDQFHWLKELVDGANFVIETITAGLSARDWLKEFICCFVRWAVTADVKILDQMRLLLKWLGKNIEIDYGGFLKKLYDKLWVRLIEDFKLELHTFLDKKYKETVLEMVEWFDNDIMYELGQVCFILSMVQDMLIEAAARIKAAIDGYIDAQFDKMILSSDLFNRKITLSIGLPIIDIISKVLEFSIDFIDECGPPATRADLEAMQQQIEARFETKSNDISLHQPTNLTGWEQIDSQFRESLGVPESAPPSPDGLPEEQEDGQPENLSYNKVQALGYDLDIPAEFDKATPYNSWHFGEPREMDFGFVLMPVSAILDGTYKDQQAAEEQMRRCSDLWGPEKLMKLAQVMPPNFVNARFAANYEAGT